MYWYNLKHIIISYVLKHMNLKKGTHNLNGQLNDHHSALKKPEVSWYFHWVTICFSTQKENIGLTSVTAICCVIWNFLLTSHLQSHPLKITCCEIASACLVVICHSFSLYWLWRLLNGKKHEDLNWDRQHPHASNVSKPVTPVRVCWQKDYSSFLDSYNNP